MLTDHCVGKDLQLEAMQELHHSLEQHLEVFHLMLIFGAFETYLPFLARHARLM